MIVFYMSMFSVGVMLALIGVLTAGRHVQREAYCPHCDEYVEVDEEQ